MMQVSIDGWTMDIVVNLLTFSFVGEDGVPLSTVVKLTKLAYCYEQWEFYDNIIENVISAIKVIAL